MGKCNHCFVKTLRRRAARAGWTFEIRRRAGRGFPDGVDIYLDGEFKVWLPKVPKGKDCESPPQYETRPQGSQ